MPVHREGGMRLRALLVLAPVLVSLGCASGGMSKTESATAPDADLPGCATFGWLPSGAAEASPAPIAEANLRNAIRARLVAKGYREVEAEPDFQVGFERAVSTRERASSPPRIGIGVGSWGGHVGTGVGASVPVGSGEVTTTQETRLTIRAVEPGTRRELWIGSASGDIGGGLDAAVVGDAVAGILEEFPERRR
jgi:hypothetical protein